MEIPAEVEYELPDGPTISGFIFDGWYFQDGRKCGDTEIFNEAVTLTAKYMTTVQVTLSFGHGIDNQTIEVKEGTYYTLPEAPEIEGFIFDGWYRNGIKQETSVLIYESMIFSASYKEAIKVTIVYGNGLEDKVEYVEKNNNYTLPEAPQIEGKLFEGWYIDDEKIVDSQITLTKDAILTAKYKEALKLTIIYGNGIENEVHTIEKGTIYPLPTAPEVEGHNFDGWYLNGIKCDSTISITSDTAIEAKYTLKKVTVTVVRFGYTNSVYQVDWGSTFTLPRSPSIHGYRFEGWFIENKKVETDFEVTSDTVLTALLVDLKEDSFDFVLKADNTYEITGIKDKNCTQISIPSTCYELPVTSIGTKAFAECSKAEYIYLPESLISIGDYAFQNCSSLTEIRIPDSVTTIGDYAFQGCTALYTCHIGTGLTQIGMLVFTQCPILNFSNQSSTSVYLAFHKETYEKMGNPPDITIPAYYSTISNSAFQDCNTLKSITIGNGVKLIAQNAFKNCTSLTKLNLSNTVTDIYESAFSYCTGLEEVTIPGSVKELGNYAFSNCSNLKKVVISDGVKKIGSLAFGHCENLVEVDILSTNGLSFESNLFAYCPNLTQIYINSSNPSYSASDGMIFNKSKTILYSYPSAKGKVTIPSSVKILKDCFLGGAAITEIEFHAGITSIGSLAFCTGLTRLILPDGLTQLKRFDFQNCSSLNYVFIPKSVISIYRSPFNNVNGNNLTIELEKGTTEIFEGYFQQGTGITKVIIPDTVTQIGDYAFLGSDLASMDIPLSVTEIGSEVFGGCPLTEINYAGTLEQWRKIKKNSSWALRSNISIIHCSDEDSTWI